MTKNNWAVFRQDFTGNEFVVEKNLSKEQADAKVAEFESHHHHQHYWACEIKETGIDFTEMLRQSLGSGSSLDVSLKILRNQKATFEQCIRAVHEVIGESLAEAEHTVQNSTTFAD